MDDTEFKYPVLHEARRSFRSFYTIATPDDRTWMDTLVLAWVALTQGMNIPREVVPATERNGLERTCDAVESQFMRARDQVRGCLTFRKLVPGDQRRIAAILFELFPPTE